MKEKILGLMVIIMLFSSLALVGTVEFTEFEPNASFPYLQVFLLGATMVAAGTGFFFLQKKVDRENERLPRALRDGQDLKFLVK